MAIKDFLGFNKHKRADVVTTVDDVLPQAILGSDVVDVSNAMNIPAIAQAVHLISETVSMIPIKLYSEEFIDGKKKDRGGHSWQCCAEKLRSDRA